MMTAPQDTNKSSPSLVDLAMRIRAGLKVDPKTGRGADKFLMKAAEVAEIYHANHEKISASELDVLYEVLREFGIMPAHVPNNFHEHVANVQKCLEVKNRTLTASHVPSLIFSRI